MSGRKIERRKLEKGQKTSRMKITCLVDLESVFSKATLTGSDPSNKEDYLIEEVTEPTPIPVREKINGASRWNNGENLSPEVEGFISDLLIDLFRKTNISKSDVDYIFAFSDSFSCIEEPADISKIIDGVLDFCVKELEGYPSKINLDPPLLAANELRARTGMTGARRISYSRIPNQSIPEAYLDLSTYLSGLSKSSRNGGNEGLVTGLALEIMDALARGAGGINSKYGNLHQLPPNNGKVYEKESVDLALRTSKLIEVRRVPSGTERAGKIPVDVGESYDRKTKLIGCDVGLNGGNLEKVTKIGQRASSYGLATLKITVEKTFARMIGKIIKSMYEEELINLKTRVCISSRRKITEESLEPVLKHLKGLGFEKIAKNLIFIENPANFGLLKAI